MERDIWIRMMAALKHLPRTRPRNAVYTHRQILAVLLRAAIHDRPISWACERRNWPMQAWRRTLPDQSTMSRRLRHPDLVSMLLTLLLAVQGDEPVGQVLVADGKPLELSEYTRDPEAAVGRGAGRMAKGYKVHLILDPHSQRVVGHQTHPLNVAETTTVAALVAGPEVPIPRGSLLLGDTLFDSNPLHHATHARGCQLIVPRKKPGTALGSRRHHPNRLESIRFTEGKDREIWDRVLAPQRAAIERFFGAWASFGGGLSGLPPWIRRLHRVRVWVAAKLVINAARIQSLKERHAA
jgi:hypothetical protein